MLSVLVEFPISEEVDLKLVIQCTYACSVFTNNLEVHVLNMKVMFHYVTISPVASIIVSLNSNSTK